MVSVIGAGAWGRALYSILKLNLPDAVITSRKERKIEGFVPWEEALKNSHLILAVAAQGVKELVERIPLHGKRVLIASKGIDVEKLQFLHQLVGEKVEEENLAFLGGPSFAREVMEQKPTALVIASKGAEVALEFKKMLQAPFLKIYLDRDVEGVEVAGAYKNVIALASGISTGLQLGENARAALLARGLVEMARFGEVFGAKMETFLGIAGAGDLFLTANSTLSRNFRVGMALAQGKKLKEILESLGEVAEGVYTTKAIYQLSQAYNIYTPIATEVYKIIYQGKSPQESLKDLIKEERS
ncbi:MAG: NAD(P)H-dependent glycerol-3-phosphate dehydrogenase [Epsilonproteobacteria bacterium]|jgi:glycerol-3-phosphate dehydrogenase (NAD(P)+)|nr:NAD(P)H-dependent glycerol-3-phosphate dehydrogenase [Campylobacterota bacterium]NPA88970.1 NAD(P)H-dependent glycerol-3-phosphate dehydrogenase [Campylobacterota bacterium]